MYLFIDTSEQKEAVIGLIDGEGKMVHECLVGAGITPAQRGRPQGSPLQSSHLEESLLPAIDKLLSNHNKTVRDLSGIIVISGPGGFTSLRIGLSTANTLGWTLGMPVVGLKSGCDIKQALIQLDKTKKFQPIMPDYGREPNITRAKSV